MKKTKIFTSFQFKSWSYFVLFALSIVLLLQFFQLILMEPFYKRTLRNEVKSLVNQIANIYFTEDENVDINSSIYSLTVNNDACILIYDTKNGTTLGYDAIGESGCAIYNDTSVNKEYIDKLSKTEDTSIMEEGQLIELSNKEIMIYGKKFTSNDNEYFIYSNITLQSINYITKTLQGQIVIISLIVVILSLLVSLLFSSIITQPILSMTKEAKKMSYGDFDLHFDVSDINEVDELAITMQLAAKEVGKIEDFRKELIANVSHDIKTPLTMIKAYAEMIKDISGNDELKRNEHLDVILQESDSLNKLVSDMLDLSKLQTSSISIEQKPFDLTTLVANSISRFQTIAHKDSVQIINECEPELIAIGDVNRINEVLYNFISNALKHYGDDKQIIVSAHLQHRSSILVQIIDHGTGINEEELPYIWDRYFKIDKKYTRAQTGTGLGLAINKAILECHKANYGVISHPNEGSTFYFELKAFLEE